MFALKFLGDPQPCLWCALGSIGERLKCVKTLGSSTPRGRNLVFRKSPHERVNMSVYNFWLVDQSSPFLFQ